MAGDESTISIESETLDADVLIVGGGMVGSLLAAALAEQTALSVIVLEADAPAPFERGSRPPYDIRVSALSLASQRMLERVGAWQGIVDRRACPFTEMRVWDGEAGGNVHFQAREIGAPVLGHIVENRVLQLALLERLQVSDSLRLLCPARLSHFSVSADTVEVTLDDGRKLTTRLLIGADGARSRVRELAGIRIDAERYPQHALVASIETGKPQQCITWQRFVPTGPQAFLPLCGARASMVWYHDAEEVKRLLALDERAFIDAMTEAFPAELGVIERVIQRASFPISKAHASTYVASRVALIGDAAHTVHPLAGQGVNLGLLDAGVLAEVILETHRAGRDIGARRYLRRYERWRRDENRLMIHALDGFHEAFMPRPEPIRRLRSTALDLANRGGPLKRLVMRHAVGRAGRLPTLAR